LAEQAIHLFLIATTPEGQQTTQSHIGLGLTVVSPNVYTPESLELRSVCGTSGFLYEFLIVEIGVGVDVDLTISTPGLF